MSNGVTGEDQNPRRHRTRRPKPKNLYYVVRRGRQVGIFTDPDTYMDQVRGVSGAEGKSFPSLSEAEDWLCGNSVTSNGTQGAHGRKKGKKPTPKPSRAGPPPPSGPPPPPQPSQPVSTEARISRELPPQQPISPSVTSKLWHTSVAFGTGSDFMDTILSTFESVRLLQDGIDFFMELDTALFNLAKDSWPDRSEDARIERAKDDLVKEMEQWNPPMNRRKGFSKQLMDATWSFKLKPFGSYASKLHSKGSDVDLQIDGSFYVPAERKHKHALEMSRADAQKFIHVFGARLSNLPAKYRVQKIPNARTPIVKVRDLDLGISCDIAFPNNTVDWPKSELLLVLNHLDYRLRYVLSLVKMWAGASQLRDASMGRFNTYTLTSLLIFYFQTVNIFPPLEEIISPKLVKAATRYEDLSTHISDMARRARRWQQQAGRVENTDGVMELFLLFLAWIRDTFEEILGYGDKSMRKPLKIVTLTATISGFAGSDTSGNVKLLHVADPFDTEDNSARALSLTCLSHAYNCASSAIEACREMDVDDWIEYVFMEVKNPPKKTGSTRPRRRGRRNR